MKCTSGTCTATSSWASSGACCPSGLTSRSSSCQPPSTSRSSPATLAMPLWCRCPGGCSPSRSVPPLHVPCLAPGQTRTCPVSALGLFPIPSINKDILSLSLSFLKLLFSEHLQYSGKSAKCLLKETPKCKGSNNIDVYFSNSPAGPG